MSGSRAELHRSTKTQRNPATLSVVLTGRGRVQQIRAQKQKVETSDYPSFCDRKRGRCHRVRAGVLGGRADADAAVCGGASGATDRRY